MFCSRRADCRVRASTRILAEMKLILTITFAVFTLANSACVKKDGGPVQCCNQREHGGSLHCCLGTNSSCSMSTAGFVNRSRCYCDERCKVARDCCPDYESFNKTCGFAWDPCSSNPCQNGGICDDKGDGTYGCSCQSGFTGDNCQKQTRRKFFVSDITPNVPNDTINWGYEDTASFVRVVAPVGAVVTRIGLSKSGRSFTSYRQETVPSNRILCIPSLRNNQAVMQAELDGAPLIPQQPNNFPPVVNPQIISRNSPSSPIQSFRFTSSADGSSGPVYAYQERSRCQQRGAGDLTFVFQQAGPAATFQWQDSRINDPRSPRFWNALFPDFCFIKALVTGSRSDTVIYVKSTGKAPGQRQLDYGYTAEKSTRLRAGNEGVACLEYRCNGGLPAYQTHLQLITLTGRCEIIGLNDILQSAQGRCTVPPDADSNQENNFCIPDLNGGAAGLYRGNQGLARFRCLTGDNNYNEVRSIPTNVNPTVRLTCD